MRSVPGPFFALLSLFFLLVGAGCDAADPLSCGPGTVRSGDQCVADRADLSDGGVYDGGAYDAGTARGDGGPPPADAGDDWSTLPPGSPPPEPGCDEASGACDAWAGSLLSLIASHPGRGCSAGLSRVDGAQTVSDRHARHQASVDMLDSSSPDGDLFTQVRAEGVTYSYAGALFSVTRMGAGDVMDRWRADGRTRAVLDQCWTMAGVSFSTGESGASFATVLLAR